MFKPAAHHQPSPRRLPEGRTAASLRLRRSLSVLALVLVAMLAAAFRPAEARCVDEDSFDDRGAAANPTPGAPSSPVPAPAPLEQLQNLVREALSRNHGVDAARLLAEAALQDTEEARANKGIQASLTASASPGLGTDGHRLDGQMQLRTGLAVGRTIYDGGRLDRIVDWRSQQAEVARLGQIGTQEQIALSVVSLAFERSRYRMQAGVYSQYVRKTGCLVEALQTLVEADRGRMSELVQARKQLQQAELQQVQAVSSARQIEVKLRRLVGDGLPSIQGLSTLLLAVPELPEMLAAGEGASDIAQLAANTGALQALARAVEAGTRPQVSWNVGGSGLLGVGSGNPRSASLNAGVTVSIPLLNPGVEHSVQAARKRAQASALQRSDALETRRARIAEVHEQSVSAFDRLRRVALVLRDSDRVRNFTLQQWQQLGRRSLFDVMAAEADHYNLRVQYVNSLHDGQQMNATLVSLGSGLQAWMN